MSTPATYTGDVLLTINSDGDWDMSYINGQPEMTDGFDTAMILSIFADPDFWQNDLTNDPAEQYISEFPAVIDNGRVDSTTLKDGKAAIEKALAWMVDIDAAESVEVIGEVLNVFGLAWEITITRGGIESRYTINWEKSKLEVRR
jgi:phage gp46-like protein